MRPKYALTLPLSLTLFACGGDPIEAGYAHFNMAEYGPAIEAFDEALVGLGADRDDPRYEELQLARCRALAHTDPTQGQESFLAVFDELGTAIDSKEITGVVREYFSVREFQDALKIVDAGIQRYGRTPELTSLIARLEEESTRDPGLRHGMESMNYLGGNR